MRFGSKVMGQRRVPQARVRELEREADESGHRREMEDERSRLDAETRTDEREDKEGETS